jgi:hypothetical protein
MNSHLMGKLILRVVASICIVAVCVVNECVAQNEANPSPLANSSNEVRDDVPGKLPPSPQKLPEPKGAQRLSKTYPVWVDKKEGTVIVEGQISLREGMLEMFACTRNTKEHESIVSANTKAQLVHAGLLALGAEAGTPVQFQPEYKPPTGTEIDVLVRYLDEKGKPQTARAQDWIKDIRTKKAMTFPFVFAGSRIYTDPETGKKFYQAEGGDFVCVANFGTAMLDIPVKSSKSNESLEFEALTEKIPPLGAPVHLVFKPKLKKPGAGGGEQGEKKASSAAATKNSKAK